MLSVLTYNIHKGFNRRNRHFVLHQIRQQIEKLDIDIVFLQEIHGRHDQHQSRISSWPSLSQYEFLADNMWPHFAYGKNAIYDKGHHGNAILSKYNIEEWQNIDLSRFRRASRSLLHGVIELPKTNTRLHLICVHLELLGFERRRQINILRRHITDHIDKDESIIIAGDFNDWSGRAGRRLESTCSMQEVHSTSHGRYAKTFPSHWPILQMDRVYYRQLNLQASECLNTHPWGQLSDHLPLYARFEL